MEEEKIQKLRQMDRALEQQAGMIDPKRYIGDIVILHCASALRKSLFIKRLLMQDAGSYFSIIRLRNGMGFIGDFIMFTDMCMIR